MSNVSNYVMPKVTDAEAKEPAPPQTEAEKPALPIAEKPPHPTPPQKSTLPTPPTPPLKASTHEYFQPFAMVRSYSVVLSQDDVNKKQVPLDRGDPQENAQLISTLDESDSSEGLPGGLPVPFDTMPPPNLVTDDSNPPVSNENDIGQSMEETKVNRLSKGEKRRKSELEGEEREIKSQKGKQHTMKMNWGLKKKGKGKGKTEKKQEDDEEDVMPGMPPKKKQRSE